MKPCSRNRKRIAWLAVDALDAGEAAAICQHLANCEGCRSYWEEISTVTAQVAAASPDSTLEASAAFHRRVAERLQAGDPSSALEELVTWLRSTMLGWRVALPAMAVLVMAAFVFAVVQHRRLISPAAPVVEVPLVPASETDQAPTLANYEAAANQSLDKLDELLTKQGSQRLPPAPVLTAWSLETTDRPF